MDKFERIGVNKQLGSTSVAEAKHHFKISCDICCKQGRCLWHECDNCIVSCYHDYVVAFHRDQEKKNAEKKSAEGDNGNA